MKLLRRLRAVFLLSILALTASSPLFAALPEAEIRTLAEQAYVYGYPLVLMDATARALARPPHGQELNRFYHQRKFPEAAAKDLIPPSFDALQSRAWLDLSKEPLILSVPAMDFRYRLLSLLSGYSEVFTSLSPRTSTTAQADYAIVGPGWSGTLPEGFRRIDAPTQMVWIVGLTQTYSEADYAAVHEMQNRYQLTPLSQWAAPAEALAKAGTLVPAKSTAVKDVAKMKAPVFFAKLAELMKSNPPAAADAPMLTKMAQLGIVPGQAFDVAQLGPKAGKALQQGADLGLAKLIAEAKGKIGKVENAWVSVTDLGAYGTKYLFRAAMAWLNLGAELPNDLLQLQVQVDSEGKPLSGAQRYVLHFDKGEFPPAMGFWSLTMLDMRQAFVANPIHRYTIVDRDPLKFNADGSLDLYIQKDSPGAEHQSNWLPAPGKSFQLVLSLYYPMQKMLDGTWSPPAVKKLPSP